MNVEYKPVNDRTHRKIPRAVQIMTHMVLGAAFACLATIALILIEFAIYIGSIIMAVL